MPPRGVKSAKRTRQYEKIKASAKKRGRSTATAKRIAAATVNKQRREAGEASGSRKSAKRSRKASSGRSRKSSTGGRRTSTRTRKSSSRRRKSSGRSR